MFNIQYIAEEKLFQINTLSTTYLMGLADGRYLGHIYYGPRIEDCRGASQWMRTDEYPFSPSHS